MAADTKDAHGSKPRGRPFPPGVSGNPGGRERIPQDVRDMLRAATPKAAKALIEALDAERPVVVGAGETATLELVPDYDVRIKAAGAVFDRLYGKPAQSITGDDGGPIPITVDLAALLERLAGK